MDFFSSLASAKQEHVPQETSDHESFADAIANRFGSGSMLTARLVPPPMMTSRNIAMPQPKSPSVVRMKGPVRLPSTPMANMSIKSPAKPAVPSSSQPLTTIRPQSSFVAVSPPALTSWIHSPNTLVIDIRPHAAYSSARIPTAISLSVPSTLLKRPLFSLEKLAAMLPSQAGRNRFLAWKAASRILVYDADASSIPDNSNLQGLLRKFQNDGFEGELAWLQGGFQSVWKTNRSLVDNRAPSPDPETETEDELDVNTRQSSYTILRTKHLPMSAFTVASTTTATVGPKSTGSSSRKPRLGLPTSATSSRPAFNPFFDTIRQNVELSHGVTERIPLRLPRRVRRRINELPFPWLQEIARKAGPMATVPHPGAGSSRQMSSESESESDWDESIDGTPNSTSDVEEGAENMAMQFYRIELAEQRRLMGVMEHHSKESGNFTSGVVTRASMVFPFSITAGVEKGAKNRYRHIWPFEHARVRLHAIRDSDSDDYVNASYVQPMGTNKRYIATQGPLPATFSDFWTLCWEQNVHVIVMLTREVEGALVKCGSYWTDEVYGPLRLRLVSTTGDVSKLAEPATERGMGFNYFNVPTPPSSSYPPGSAKPKAETIKRVFELSHTRYPKAGVRKVVHLQYLEWPDMNVPDDPRGVLGLIHQVDEIVANSDYPEAPPTVSGTNTVPHDIPLKDTAIFMDMDPGTGIAKHALGRQHSPVLLHCSAGVGRTGGYIAIDSILDAIRQEIRKKRNAEDPMDVDTSKDDLTRTVSNPLTIPVRVADGDEVVHVPFAGWGPGDELKTPMQIDGEDSGAFPDTQRWAQTVSNQTANTGSAGSRPELRTTATAIKTSTLQSLHGGSSSDASSSSSPRFPSVSVSDSDSPASSSVGQTSSLGNRVSAEVSSAKSYPPFFHYPKLPYPQSAAPHSQAKANSAPVPFTLGLLPPNNVPTTAVIDPRLRAFSAPSPVPPAKKNGGIAGSPLSNNMKPWIPGDTLVDSPMPSTRSGANDILGVSGTSGPGHLRSLSNNIQPPPSSMSRASSPPQSAYASDNPIHTDNHTHGPLSPCSTRVDYKDPRKLHEDFSPVPLSTFDDPIWEVVQDMREQRMSLCQSLRQYVFVHAAVIEGALMVVDEERDRSGKRYKADAIRPRLQMQSSDESASTTSTGKRGASPTELLKEARKGDLQLAKRPSVKRKSHNGVDEEGTFLAASRLRTMPLPEMTLPDKAGMFNNRKVNSNPP